LFQHYMYQTVPYQVVCVPLPIPDITLISMPVLK
jgi:hypothetical protein